LATGDATKAARASSWLKLIAFVGYAIAIPAVLLGSFFAIALLREGMGWNPAPAEAIMVPLIIASGVMLPWAATSLWRSATQNRAAAVIGWALTTLNILFLVLSVLLVAFAFAIAIYLFQARSAQTLSLSTNVSDVAGKSPQLADPTEIPTTFALRHKLASQMLDDLRPLLPAGTEAKASSSNQEVLIKAAPDVMARVGTFIAVSDWPDPMRNVATGEYLTDSVLRTARSFFHACAIEDLAALNKMLSLGELARLKGGAKTPEFETYQMGGIPDPAWETALRADWPGKNEALKRMAAEWLRYPLKRITEDSGIALGFGVKHFCSLSFAGAPKEFYQVTIEPGRGTDAEKARYYFSSLPPWQK
jgi:hypothetical protein